KTEFIHGETFRSQAELDVALFDYVHWYNNIRIHGTLDYLTPVEYKQKNLKKVV
ncbi:IS3 family transposase, partial [Halobacillus litoralis]|uniref:IS3 family transposase n=1 Tax=Halobacillus litoralis TaxID=45668 RepID=UPI001CD3CED4